MSRKVKFILALLFVAVLTAACGGGAAAEPTITLIENPWPASSLNVNVAKIIIEQEFGNVHIQG